MNIEKRITSEEALDLVGEFLIRAHEVGRFLPRSTRDGVQGITGTWVWTIGGVNPDGSDACNDMTIASWRRRGSFAFRTPPSASVAIPR